MGAPDQETSRAGHGKRTQNLILDAQQAERMVIATEGQSEKTEAIFDILNAPPAPTALQKAVDYILGDRVKMGLAVVFVLGVGAIATGTYLSWNEDGSVQIGTTTP